MENPLVTALLDGAALIAAMSTVAVAATPMVFPPQTSSVSAFRTQDSAFLMSGVPAPERPLGRYSVLPFAVTSRAKGFAGSTAGRAATLHVVLLSQIVRRYQGEEKVLT